MRSAILIATCLCLLAAAPVFAQSAPPVVTVNAPTASPDASVCRTLEPDDGSRIGARTVCHTAREWEALRARTERSVQDFQRRGLMTGPR